MSKTSRSNVTLLIRTLQLTVCCGWLSGQPPSGNSPPPSLTLKSSLICSRVPILGILPEFVEGAIMRFFN